MPTSLQQTDLNLPETSSFQHHHYAGFAPTFGHDVNELDQFYQQIQDIIDQRPKKDILVV